MRGRWCLLAVLLAWFPAVGGASLRASKVAKAVAQKAQDGVKSEHAAAVEQAVEEAMQDQELDSLRSQLRDVEARAHKALRAAQASMSAVAPAAAVPAAAAGEAHPARFAAAKRAPPQAPNPFSAAPNGGAPMGGGVVPMSGGMAPNPFSAGLMRNEGGMMGMSPYVGHAVASTQGGLMGYNPNKVSSPPNMYKKFQGFSPKMAQQVMLAGGGGMGGGMDPMGGMYLGPMGTSGFMRKRMKDEQGNFADSPMGAMGIPIGGMQPNIMSMMAGAGTRGGIWGANPNAMGAMGGMSAQGIGGQGAYAPVQYQVPGMGYQNPENGDVGMYPTPGTRPMSAQSPYSAYNYAGYDRSGFPLPHPGIPSSVPVYTPPKAAAAA